MGGRGAEICFFVIHQSMAEWLLLAGNSVGRSLLFSHWILTVTLSGGCDDPHFIGEGYEA